MKQMSKSSQMEVNGGAWVHCTACGKDFWGLTSAKAMAKFMNNHKSDSHRFWDYGRFADCTNCH